MIFSDDPVKDAERYIREQERYLETRPICSVCGEPIQDETALYLDDWVCNDCVHDLTRYIED